MDVLVIQISRQALFLPLMEAIQQRFASFCSKKERGSERLGLFPLNPFSSPSCHTSPTPIVHRRVTQSDGLLRQSWGIFLPGAGEVCLTDHPDLSHIAPF